MTARQLLQTVPGGTAHHPIGQPLATTYVAVAELRPDPRNPRKHSARQLKQLDRSVSAFGFVTPILVDAQNTIIAGHARHEVARRRGLATVPVVRLEHLSPAQARALAVADNRLTDLSIWDERLLGELFAELATLELDFDLEATGFSVAEIDLKIEGLTVGCSGGEDPADYIPGLADIVAVSRPGDLWHLDRHRLLCGDALQPVSYETLMPGEVARIVFSDPPYNVRIHGHVCGNGAVRHREFPMAAGEMTPEQFAEFLDAALRLQSRHSADGALLYLCMDWRPLAPADSGGARRPRAEEYLRLGQAQPWHGFVLPQPARVRGGAQARRHTTSQQRPAWQVRPQPIQRVVLSKPEQLREGWRRGKPRGPASDS